MVAADPGGKRGAWWPQVVALACHQLGLITTAQLRQLGLGIHLDRAVAAGALTRVRKGVYALPGTPRRWETEVMAAVLAAGAESVASHWTAARLWGLFETAPPPEADAAIHLTGASSHRLDGVVSHRRQLAATERTVRYLVPVTSVALTLVDLASVMETDSLGRATDEALRRRILRLVDLRRTYERHAGAGRRRLTPLRIVLEERDPGFDPGANEWEQRMDRLWDQLDLPPAERQYWIRANGRRYRVDRAIPALRLAVEWVGAEYHAQTGRYRRDRLRISDLVLAGWEVIEIAPGWAPQRILRTVMSKVAERQAVVATRGKPA